MSRVMHEFDLKMQAEYWVMNNARGNVSVRMKGSLAMTYLRQDVAGYWLTFWVDPKLEPRITNVMRNYSDLAAEAKRRGIHPNQEYHCACGEFLGSSKCCPNGPHNSEEHFTLAYSGVSEEERNRLSRRYGMLDDSEVLARLLEAVREYQ